MNAEVQTFSGVYWPVPPFFKLATPLPPQASMECDLELAKGRVLHEELVEFSAGADTVGVRWPQPRGIKRIDLAEVRSIKLTCPVKYITDATALLAIGATERGPENRKPFVVRLADGSKVTGTTLGFVQDEAGLFLFLVESDAAHVINCFMPAVQIKDVQIGPPLGEMLVEQNVVSAEALELALNQQASLRNRRVGTYLADRAIITAEELTLALRAQEKRPNVRLGEILLEAGLITSEQLQEALTIQAGQRGRRIGEILIEMGAVSLRLVQFALSDKLGIPHVNVREFKIGAGALESIDTAFAIRHQVLPLLRIGGTLVVAVEDPLSINFAQELRLNAGMTIAPVIASPQELKARISKEYSSLEGRTVAGRAGAAAGAESNGTGRHPNTPQAKLADLTSQLARETQQSGRSREVGAEPLPLDQVGFSARDLGKLKQMISRNYGLILVCGPTGSGKTTTLHSVLRELNRDGYKGRVVVYELLEGTPQIKHLVRSHASVPELVTAAQEAGMLALRQDAIEKVLRGVLDVPSARAVSN